MSVCVYFIIQVLTPEIIRLTLLDSYLPDHSPFIIRSRNFEFDLYLQVLGWVPQLHLVVFDLLSVSMESVNNQTIWFQLIVIEFLNLKSVRSHFVGFF